MPSVPNLCILNSFDLFNKNVESEPNVICGATAREVSEGLHKTLDDGASDGETAETFERFVEDVAGV